MSDAVELLKRHAKTLLFFAIAGLLGGFFVGYYVLDGYPEAIKNEIYAEGGTDFLIAVVTAFQSALYGVILGAVGMILGDRLELFKNERNIQRKPLVFALGIALISGLCMILCDVLFFGRYSEAIMNSYDTKPTVVVVIASVVYGGVIEEVMLRLFMLTLVAFILFRLLDKGQSAPSVKVLVLANVISALLFAAGHLPATAILLGLTPMTVFRCFLLNGGIGFLFGWLYHRFGLRYAMIAHAGTHVVSKLIWILFI